MSPYSRSLISTVLDVLVSALASLLVIPGTSYALPTREQEARNQAEAAEVKAQIEEVSLTASPTVARLGEAVTLRWKVLSRERGAMINASCRIRYSGRYTPHGEFFVSCNDMKVVKPFGDMTYKLLVIAATKTVASISVKVEAPPRPIVATLEIRPMKAHAGDQVTISWSARHADSVKLIDARSGSTLGGIEPPGMLVVTPTESQRYTLYASNSFYDRCANYDKSTCRGASAVTITKKVMVSLSRSDCQGYASRAVQQNEEQLSLKCGSGFTNDKTWNSSYDHHLQWCLNVDSNRPREERNKRERDLATCRQYTTPNGGTGTMPPPLNVYYFKVTCLSTVTPCYTEEVRSQTADTAKAYMQSTASNCQVTQITAQEVLGACN